MFIDVKMGFSVVLWSPSVQCSSAVHGDCLSGKGGCGRGGNGRLWIGSRGVMNEIVMAVPGGDLKVGKPAPPPHLRGVQEVGNNSKVGNLLPSPPLGCAGGQGRHFSKLIFEVLQVAIQKLEQPNKCDDEKRRHHITSQPDDEQQLYERLHRRSNRFARYFLIMSIIDLISK